MPNCRNTPATIAMMIGSGIADMTARTRPVAPTTVMTTAVATNAPRTSAQDRCSRDAATRTVPGIVHAKASGIL